MGFGELVLILILVLLFFGASRLPAVGAGLGKAIRSIKEGVGGERPDGTPPADAAGRDAAGDRKS
jgi:sec-independent protein translocase protein TatA